jgi:pimeloyl-ACP methyl ester carboxylesterase
VGIALVEDHYDDPFLDAEPRHKLFVVGERDSWAPAASLQAFVDRLRPPKELHVIPHTDHFFGRQETKVARLVVEWLLGS